MRNLAIACDVCGKQWTRDERPLTWWTLEQQSKTLTTGAMNFCSLKCLDAWVKDPRVLEAFPLDFVEVVPDGHV